MTLRDFARNSALRIPRVRAFYAHVQRLAAERDELAGQVARLTEQVDASGARAEAPLQVMGDEREVFEGLERERDDLRRGLDDALREITYQKAERERLSEALADMEALWGEVLGEAQKDEANGAAGLAPTAERVRAALEQRSALYDQLELKLYVTTSDFQRAVVMNDRLLDELRELNERIVEPKAATYKVEQARD